MLIFILFFLKAKFFFKKLEILHIFHAPNQMKPSETKQSDHPNTKREKKQTDHQTNK